MAVPLTLDEFRTPRPVAGWRVLLTTFCMALAAWGLGFYSLSVYVQYLAASGRFAASLLSAATTFHFLVGAAALYAVEYAAARVGRRAVVVAGVLLIYWRESCLARGEMVMSGMLLRGRCESVPMLGSVWGCFSPRSVLPLASVGPPRTASGAVSCWTPPHTRRAGRASGR